MEKFDSRQNWDIDILRHPAQFGYQLRIARMVDQDKKVEMASLTVQTFDAPHGYAYGPDIMEANTSLGQNQIQAIMDCLWSMGIRPSNGEGNAGELGATQSHLKDMRAIVSKKLGVEL